ncbi:MAG: Lrp/AsnC family transcriptional regulator [Candidatus Micrarchaeota archaeon]|nr:Lrp/AsnC family transcriptional regulator [Candidatus Micrarchaeota archaeon]
MAKKSEWIIEFNDIDLKDRRILHELDWNARVPVSEIARRVGLSRQTTNYRVKELIRKGVIIGFIAMPDIRKLGYSDYDIWIRVRRTEDTRKLIEYFVKHPNTFWVSECGGRWDMCASIMARNPSHFHEILNKALEDNREQIQGYGINGIIEYEWYTRGFLLPRTKREKVGSSGGEQRMAGLDRKDLTILGMLAVDARASVREIADEIGMDPATVAGRIRRMEKSGAILGYGCAIQIPKIGMRTYEVLVQMHNLTSDGEKKFKAYCSSNPFVYVYLRTMGACDVDLGIDAKDEKHLYEIISEMRSEFPELIKDFEVLSVFHTHKQNFFPRDLL